MSHEKVKEMKEVELICADCGLPIAGEHPRTDVTRYLSETSRCQCHRNGNDKGKTSESNSASAASDSNSSSSSTSSQSPNKARSSTSAHLAMAVKVGFSLDDAAEVLGERFEVIDFLGQGGMGSVFKAREKSTGTIFAVKLLNPQLVHDEQSVRRFEQEAKAAMHLTHAHLTAVYEYGVGKDDTPYLVMDYLEGTTLETLLESENHLDSNRAINLFSQLCEAISYAHLKGVIHRDIKPANIMVMQRGEGVEYAKLFDFGIAKVLPNQAIDFTQDMTQTGDLYGSPLYMSPEQCKGLPLDERTDLYSLGCVIYKSITGKHPFEGKNFVDTVVKIITTEAAPASTVNPSEKLPKGLDQVVARCLAKDPAFRYRNASLLQDDLERVRDSKLISKMAGPPATLSAAYAATSKPAVNPRILALAIVLSVSIFGSVAKNIVSVRPTV